MQCALRFQQELHRAELAEGVTLSVKVGIGVGTVSVLHMGGMLGRMEYVAVGEPLVQAFSAEEQVRAGAGRGGAMGVGGGPIVPAVHTVPAVLASLARPRLAT